MVVLGVGVGFSFLSLLHMHVYQMDCENRNETCMRNSVSSS